MALLDLAVAQRRMDDGEAAMQTIDAVMSLPTCRWHYDSGEVFCPFTVQGDSRYLATRLKRGL